MTALLLLGFLVGMRHALEADHVAAVATLASRSHSLGDALRQGAFWGLGHTITLFLFGSIALLVDGIMPQRFAEGLEFAVGLMLLVLGFDVLRRLYKDRVHFHAHQHDHKPSHFHAHSHRGEVRHSDSTHQHKHPETFPKRALLIGLMHGMAGSAALIVLTLQTIDSAWTGLLYMALFGAGSIVGMAVLSVAISIPMRYSSKRISGLYTSLQLGVSLLTIGIGGLIVIDFLQPLIIKSGWI
jgi:ABC-type nickel/cobalt efflux system permease component RcnA